MEKLLKNLDHKIEVSAIEVADLFCSMDGEEQALFFNKIAENVAKWNNGFIFQLQAICDTELLNDGGKKIMREIGEYSDGISWMEAKRKGI